MKSIDICIGLWNSIGCSQDPKGLKEYIHQLQNDPAAEYGYNYAKERDILLSMFNSPTGIGLPFQFCFTNETIEMATGESNFDDLIRPTNKWYIPVQRPGYTYHALVKSEGEMFRPSGCGEGVFVQGGCKKKVSRRIRCCPCIR